METEWLRDAVQLALEAPLYATSADDDFDPPEQPDPRFGKLIEGTLYSSRFIKTYHIVVWGVVMILAAVRWARAARRRARAARLQIAEAGHPHDGGAPETDSIQRMKINNQDTVEEASSSRSSTLAGTMSPPTKDADEQTPLLRRDEPPRPPYPGRAIILYIKSFLMYQPPPIPLFNKTLPSNGVSLVLLAFVSLNVFYTFFHINFDIFELAVLADRCSLVFVANLPLLYIMAAKNQPLSALTGHSYEVLNIFHRRLGEILCLEAILHAAGMIGVWYTLLGPDGYTVGRFLSNRIIVLGISALTVYQVLYFTSLASFRQKYYEVFLGLHVALQAAALVLVYFHHPATRIYVGVALAIFLIDRLVYRIGVKSATVEAAANISEDDETVKLSIEILRRPNNQFLRLFGRSITYGWKASDHVFVTVPSLARKHIIQAHPFTIASPAPAPEADRAQLDLLVRAQDGFSSDLLQQVRDSDRLQVRLDGPYGSAHARTMLEDSDLAIVVAGGSGIAVGWPLVNHLLDTTRSSDTEIAPIASLRRQKIVLIWVVHKGSHVSWIGRTVLATAEGKGVEIIIPGATEEIGRPDLDTMIRDLVKDYGEGRKIGVVTSGPDSMTRGVRNTCAKLVWGGKDVDVVVEKFGW